MKKFISLLMAAAMAMTTIPATVFAANANTSLVGGVQVVTEAGAKDRIEANEVRVKIDSDSTLKVGDTATFTLTVRNAVFLKKNTKTSDKVKVGDVLVPDDAQNYTDIATIFPKYDADGNTTADGDKDGFTMIKGGRAAIASIKFVDVDDSSQTIEVKVRGLVTGDTIVLRPSVEMTKTSKNTKVTLDVSTDKNISKDFSATIITIGDTEMKVAAAVTEQSEEKANDGEKANLGKIVIDDTIAGSLIKEGYAIRITLKGDYAWSGKSANAKDAISGVSSSRVEKDDSKDEKVLKLTIDETGESNGRITIYKDTLQIEAIDDVSAGNSVKATFEILDHHDKSLAKVSNVKLLDVVKDKGISISLADKNKDAVRAWSGITDDGDAWEGMPVKLDGLDSNAFNEKRDVVVSFPSGVILTDVEFENDVFKVKKYNVDKNELTLGVMQDAAKSEGKETLTFHFVTESTFNGDVKATFNGSALDDKYSVVIAESKPIAVLDVSSAKVESGYKSTKIPGTVTFTEAEAELFKKGDEFQFIVPQGKANTNTNLNAFELELSAKADAKSDGEVTVQKDDRTVKVKSQSDEKAMVVTLSDLVVYLPTTTALGSYKLRASAPAVFDADDLEVTSSSSLYKDIYEKAGEVKKGSATLYKASTVGALCSKEDVDFDQYIESKDNFIEVVSAGMISQTQTSAFTKAVDVPIGAAKIVVDGIAQTIDAPAYINKDNRTMVPLRAVAVALGVSDDQIVWIPSERTVIVNYADTWISMVIGSQIMKVNGIEMAMTTAPEITNSRTFLPMADLGRALGVTAVWDAAAKTASFNK